MTHTKFHLGVFHTFGPPAWQAAEDRLHGGDWWNGDFFIELAQRMERAKFDFLFFEDTSAVSDQIGGTIEADLRYCAYSPKHDVMPLLGALSKATEHLGLMATASTTFYPPWMLARLFSTLDSLSGGRIGWNIVTSAEEASAANFGLDLPEHDRRYDMADEYLQVVKELWAAWEPDALVRDPEANLHVDPAKVRPIDHEGSYFRVRGPLNVLPSPQGFPLLVQAGASERGREFAAKHAEVVFASMEGGIEGMKAFRQDLRERAVRHGRGPDDVKVSWATFVDFREPGWDPAAPVALTDAQFDYAITFWSATTDIDLASFPLDEPFPADLEPRGHTTFFTEFQRMGKEGKTLREAIIAVHTRRGEGQTDLTGTPQQIAEKMIAVMDEVGTNGDGFMIFASYISNPKYLDALIDQLAPALQEAGATRTSYPGSGTLRQSLAEL